MACTLALIFSLLLLPAVLLADQSFLRAAAETNVNQHYTIESIYIGGVKVEEVRLPSALRTEIASLVGERCDVARLEDLASDLRRELHLRAVTQSLLRGSQPGRVRVNFDVVRKQVSFDLSVPSLRYSSEQQWSGELDATAHAGRNSLRLGILSNGDELAERFEGISARFQNTKLGTERLRFRLDIEDYNTERVAYTSRTNVAPEITLSVARPFTISAGLSFQQMNLPGGASLAANALTAEAHYGRAIEGYEAQQKVDARYNLRAGAATVGSDFEYNRHTVVVRYEVKSGRKTASDELTAGIIAGEAPSFERFVLGSHFAPDTKGGSRVVRNSVTYGYQFGERTGEAFYDTGTTGRGVRHSAGVAYRQGIFMVAVAFPFGEGRALPVFMAGMNY